MDLLSSLPDLPAQKYAVLGVGLLIVLGFLVKTGIALFVRVILVVGFLLLALFLYFSR